MTWRKKAAGAAKPKPAPKPKAPPAPHVRTPHTKSAQKPKKMAIHRAHIKRAKGSGF